MKKLLFVLVFIPYFSFSQKGEGYVIQHRPIQDAQVSQTEVKIDSDFKVATINAERNLLAMANKDNTVVYFNLDENTLRSKGFIIPRRIMHGFVIRFPFVPRNLSENNCARSNPL